MQIKDHDMKRRKASGGRILPGCLFAEIYERKQNCSKTKLSFSAFFSVCKFGESVLLGNLDAALDQRQGVVYEFLRYIGTVFCDPFQRNRFFLIADLMHVFQS